MVTPLRKSSLIATSVAALAACGPIRNTGMNSYSELCPSCGLPSSSSSPLLPGSEVGWQWMLISPGKTIRPAPSISLPNAPS